MGIAGDLIIIIIVWTADRPCRQPPQASAHSGYIIAGTIIGPHTGGITVSSAHEVELLAEIG